jgi:hypothetical protein
MATSRNAGKLPAKTAARAPLAPASAPIDAQQSDEGMGDALSLIRSLTADREGAEWNVKVYQVIGGVGRGTSGRQQFLFEVALEDLPQLEAALAEQFPAGGVFRVAIRADNQLIKNPLLDIAPRPGYRAPLPAYLQAAPSSPPAAGAPAGESATDRLLLQLIEMNRASEERTARMIQSLAERFTLPAPAPAPTLADQIETFTKLQALIPTGAQANTMEVFEKGMSFAQKIYDARDDSGGGTGSTWVDIVRDALSSPNVKEIIAGAMAGAGAAVAAPAGALPPAPATVTQAPAAAPAPALDPKNPAVLHIIETLAGQAASGADPAAVAEQALAGIPPAILDELESHEDIAGHLCGLFPQLAPHRAWLEAVIANMYEGEQPSAASPTMNDPNARLSDSPPGIAS